MPKSKIPSPARSDGVPKLPRRHKNRSTRSVGSPARSTAAGRLSSVIDQFKEQNRDSFSLSPFGKSVLTDDTDIEQPRRASWYKKVDNSRDVTEVLDNNDKGGMENNFIEELDFEVLSQEKKDYSMDIPDSSGSESISSIVKPQRKLFTQKENAPQKRFSPVIRSKKISQERKDYSVDLPDSSGSESISSIVIPQRKLFTQKENVPQNRFSQIIKTRESLTKQNKTNIADKTAEAGPRNLFSKGTKRSKPVFPAALLNFSPVKTVNKTKGSPTEVKGQARNLFGNHPAGTKRKNMFADFILSESEDDISDIQPKLFAFQQNSKPVRHSSVRRSSARLRENSPASSFTTDIEIDDWKLLPSSTMVEHQIEAVVGITPGKTTRLSKLSEAKEVTNSTANKTKQLNKSNSKNHSKTSLSHLEKSKSGKKHVEETPEVTEEEEKQGEEDEEDGDEDDNQEAEQGDEEIETEQQLEISRNNVQEIEQDEDREAEHSDQEIETEQKLENSRNDEQEIEQNEEDQEVEEEGEEIEQEGSDNEEQNESQEIQDDEEEIVNASQENEEHSKDEGNYADIQNESAEKENEEENEDDNHEENDSAEIEHEQDNEDDGQENESAEIENEEENESENQEEIESAEIEIEQDNEDNNQEENESAKIENEEENEDDGQENESAEIQNEQDNEDDGQENESAEIEMEEENEGKNQSAEIEHEEEKEDENQEENESIEIEHEEENEDENQEKNESTEIEIEQENEDDNQEENESAEIEMEEENEDDNQEENDDDDQEDNQMSFRYSDESQEIEDDQEQNEEEEIEQTATKTPNVSHDTTGRNRNKDDLKSPEAILHSETNLKNSFIVKGRNTSVRKTETIFKHTPRPSLAPIGESTGFSDGTKNSSAEGSGWDSHRTTRKTLRQTFGRDFTPRKSLRALVMEKSAKRQTAINEANAALHLQDGNPAEVVSESLQDEMEYEENIARFEQSDHEVSQRTRQTTLEMYLQEIKKENIEKKQKIEQQVRNSLKFSSRMDVLNRIPSKPYRRLNAKPLKAEPKKRIKQSVISLEDLPPEFAEDLKYKPPSRYQLGKVSWVTKRLYNFLESKLEPKYNYKARVRAEKLVQMIYEFSKDVQKRKDKVAPPRAVAELKHEMARLDVVKTHFEFYNFFHDYMPLEVKIKVVPDIINDIPLPINLFGNIIEAN